MTYSKPLPREKSLVRLASIVDFPATRDEIISIARRKAFPITMMSFLNLFSIADTFESRIDFLDQALELEILIRQDRESTKEFLRSPQG